MFLLILCESLKVKNLSRKSTTLDTAKNIIEKWIEMRERTRDGRASCVEKCYFPLRGQQV